MSKVCSERKIAEISGKIDVLKKFIFASGNENLFENKIYSFEGGLFFYEGIQVNFNDISYYKYLTKIMLYQPNIF